MVINGEFKYKGETVQFDDTGNPIIPAQEWSASIPCNIQLKTREERIYLGGEYTTVTGQIIVAKTCLKMLSVVDITKVTITKGQNNLGERKVLFVEDLPITNNLKIYI